MAFGLPGFGEQVNLFKGNIKSNVVKVGSPVGGGILGLGAGYLIFGPTGAIVGIFLGGGGGFFVGNQVGKLIKDNSKQRYNTWQTQKAIKELSNNFSDFTNQNSKNLNQKATDVLTNNDTKLNSFVSIDPKNRYGSVGFNTLKALFESNLYSQEQLTQSVQEIDTSNSMNIGLSFKDSEKVESENITLDNLKEHEFLRKNQIINDLFVLREYVLSRNGVFDNYATKKYDEILGKVEESGKFIFGSLKTLTGLTELMDKYFKDLKKSSAYVFKNQAALPIGDYSKYYELISPVKYKKVALMTRSNTRNINDALNKLHDNFKKRISKRTQMLLKASQTLLDKANKGETITKKDSKELLNIFGNLHFFTMKHGKSKISENEKLIKERFEYGGSLKLPNGDNDNGAFVTRSLHDFKMNIRTFEQDPKTLHDFLVIFDSIIKELYEQCDEMCNLAIKFIKSDSNEETKESLSRIRKKAEELDKHCQIKTDFTQAIIGTKQINQSDDWIDNWLDLLRNFVNNLMVSQEFADADYEFQSKILDLGHSVYALNTNDERSVFAKDRIKMRGSDISDDFMVAFIEFSKQLKEAIEPNQYRADRNYKQEITENLKILEASLEKFEKTIPNTNNALKNIDTFNQNNLSLLNDVKKNYSNFNYFDSLLNQLLKFYNSLNKELNDFVKEIFYNDESEFKLLESMVHKYYATMSASVPSREMEFAEYVSYLESNLREILGVAKKTVELINK